MKVPVEIRKVNLGEHPGFQKEALDWISASGAEEFNGIYCSGYCRVDGFCYSCGLSRGKPQLFGFRNGLSVNFQEGLEAEFGVDEKNFDGRMFDEIFDHEESLKYYRGEVPEEVCHYDPFPEKTGLRC